MHRLPPGRLLPPRQQLYNDMCCGLLLPHALGADGVHGGHVQRLDRRHLGRLLCQLRDGQLLPCRQRQPDSVPQGLLLPHAGRVRGVRCGHLLVVPWRHLGGHLRVVCDLLEQHTRGAHGRVGLRGRPAGWQRVAGLRARLAAVYPKATSHSHTAAPSLVPPLRTAHSASDLRNSSPSFVAHCVTFCGTMTSYGHLRKQVRL